MCCTGSSAPQLAGHDIGVLIDRITAAPMDGARSIASVLHYRLQQLALPELAGHEISWAQRTPDGAPAIARELAAGLDDRACELGDRMTADPEPWLASQLGVLAPAASPALREEYARRAGVAAAYREAAGITDPQQAVSFGAHRDNPELENLRQATIAALEIRDEADLIRGLDRGELEARVLRGERVQATAPPEVSSQLRLTAQAEADTLQQSATARTRRDLATLSPRVTCRPIRAATRRRWPAGGTSSRPMPKPPNAPSPASTRLPSTPGNPGRHSTPPDRACHLCRPDPQTRSGDEPIPASPAADDRAARLDELRARADRGAQRVAAQEAGRQASRDYAARVEREAQAGPERQAETQVGAEIEP